MDVKDYKEITLNTKQTRDSNMHVRYQLPYKRTCMATKCQMGLSSLCHLARAVFWIRCWCCRSPHTHTHTPLGEGLNCACASLSENLIDNGKCQKNRYNSILLIWRSFDPRIKIVIKIRLIAQPYETPFLKRSLDTNCKQILLTSNLAPQL